MFFICKNGWIKIQTREENKMIPSGEDFLMTFIGYGQLDLRLIDDVEYDWCNIVRVSRFLIAYEKGIKY